MNLSFLPLVPSRLLEIIDILDILRLNTLVVRWGDLFPWKFDERVQAPGAYHEHVMAGFYRYARAKGIRVFTLVPGPDYLGFVLRIKSFTYLRRRSDIADILDVQTPGAVRIVEEMMEDIAGICDETGLYLETDGIGVTGSTAPRSRDGVLQKDNGRGDYFRMLSEGARKLCDGIIIQGAGDWSSMYLNDGIPNGTILSGNVLLVPSPGKRYTRGYLPDILPWVIRIVHGASYLWNGGVSVDIGAVVDRLLKTYPEVETFSKGIQRFDDIIREIFCLAAEMKQIHSFLLSSDPDRTAGDLYIEELLDQASDMTNRVREEMAGCIAIAEQVIDGGDLRKWCSVKMLTALDDLQQSAGKIRLCLDVRLNSERPDQRE